MAVSRLGTASSAQGASTLTLSHAIAAGSDRCIAVAITTEANGDAVHASCLWGDQAMTKFEEGSTSTSGIPQVTSIWLILESAIAVASGTTIDPTFTTAQPLEVQLHAQSYEGVHQGGGTDTVPDSANTATLSGTPNPLITDVTGVTDGAVYAARGSGSGSSFTWLADVTNELTDEADASSGGSSADTLTASAGNVDVEGTASAQNRGAQAAIVLAPAVVTGAVTSEDTGNRYNICQRSGMRVKPGELMEEWNGVKVRPESFEPRNTQDFVRVRAELLTGAIRPEPIDKFISTSISPEDL